MGMEAYKIASALRGVVAQRLMRRICPACRAPSTDPVPERAAPFIAAGTKLFRAVGCPECTMTGYRGRFSIVEVLTMNSELEHLIGLGTTADKLADEARAGGMGSLWESGLRHVLAGESTVEELLRVTDPPQAVPEQAAAPPRPSRTSRAVASPVAPPEPSPAPADRTPGSSIS